MEDTRLREDSLEAARSGCGVDDDVDEHDDRGGKSLRYHRL